MIEYGDFRVWLDKKIGTTEYWSYERVDGTGTGGKFQSQEEAEAGARASISERPIKQP